MKKSVLLGLAAVGGLLAACAAPEPLSKLGRLNLDAAASTLSAISVKNDTVEVPVAFSALQGWAEASGKAEIRIPLASMSTGNEGRDANIKKWFFELDKAAGFATATFTLTSLDADVSTLADGQRLSLNARGTLALHGASSELAGPLTLSRQGKTLTVTLGEGWAVLIDKAGMSKPLKALNQNCPQPHKVGNAVKLKGSLVFKG
jgi:polyisoprenoid-binding protein YceI